MVFEICHDNDFDLAHWFYLNSELVNSEVLLRQIPKTNSAKDLQHHLKIDSDLTLLPAIKYETPDLVLIRKNEDGSASIELVVEFMTHTPQHDHPLQRFTRIYGSAWLGIPSILIIPQKKEKLEKGKREDYSPTIYRANPLIYHLFLKTSEITKTNTLLLMWPEVDGYLKYDKLHPTAPRVEEDIALLMDIVNAIVKSSPIDELLVSHKKKQIEDSGYNVLGNKYDLTTGSVMGSKEVLKQFQISLPEEEQIKFSSREESFLYSPQGLKSGKSDFRTDPYAGKVCAFDILFCRDSLGRRIRNLVLRANKIPATANGKLTLKSNAHEKKGCPFIKPTTLKAAADHFANFCPYTERKQQRIYGEIPDMVIFDGGEIYVP